MFQIIDALANFDTYTITVVSVFVVASAFLVREITGSTSLAIVSAPVLLVGALAANFIFRSNFFIAAYDKDTNIVVATAVGVIFAMVLLLIAIWLAICLSEYRSKRKKFMRLPDVPPSI